MTDTSQGRPGNPASSSTGHAVSPSQHWIAPVGGPRGVSRDLARQIIVGYTSPGDCVIDVGKDVELSDACLRAGRRYHALEGVEHLAGIGHAAGYIDLLYLRWPAAAANDQWLMIACGALLRGTGQLMCVIDTHQARGIADGPSRRLVSPQVARIAESARFARLHTREVIDVYERWDGPARRMRAPASARRPHTELVVLGWQSPCSA